MMDCLCGIQLKSNVIAIETDSAMVVWTEIYFYCKPKMKKTKYMYVPMKVSPLCTSGVCSTSQAKDENERFKYFSSAGVKSSFTKLP